MKNLSIFYLQMKLYRYHPTCHRILQHLTDEFGVKTMPFSSGESMPNSFTHYMRNQRLDGLKDIKKMFSVSDDELPYLLPTINSASFDKSAKTHDLEIPEDGNHSMASIRSTGELANSFSMASYLMMSDNSELVNFNISNHGYVTFPVNLCAARQEMMSKDASVGLRKIVGGFQNLIARIVSSLSSIENVELQLNQRVRQVSETNNGFGIATENLQHTSRKVIFASGIQGLRCCDVPQPHQIRQLTDNVRMGQGFKLFLTYKTAWWEDYGMHLGTVITDLPNQLIIAFGKDGKSDTHATLLVAYTNQLIPLIESLDCESLERFKNIEGYIAEEQIPSKILVSYLQQQLKLVLGKTKF